MTTQQYFLVKSFELKLYYHDMSYLFHFIKNKIINKLYKLDIIYQNL